MMYSNGRVMKSQNSEVGPWESYVESSRVK